MTTIKVSEATGQVLDYLVATCEGYGKWDAESDGFERKDGYVGWWSLVELDYSDNWHLAGPIIERELSRVFQNVGGTWTATKKLPVDDGTLSGFIRHIHGVGSTLLIAAMRCYVASKMGEEVEVPEELLNGH